MPAGADRSVAAGTPGAASPSLAREHCGEFLRVERPLWEVWPEASRLWEHWVPPRRCAGWPAELQALAAGLPEEVILLDLETCGLAGSAVFLVGLIWHARGQWHLVQLLARHYGEEKAVLQAAWDYLGQRTVLVSFNGKAFDLTVLRDRSIVHNLGGGGAEPWPEIGGRPWTSGRPAGQDRSRPALIHCDLLHHARRRWGSQLPDCRLVTLEQSVCGRLRRGDIPGPLIPDLYHEAVRRGDLDLLRPVLHHNALDLVTLWQLSLMLAGS